MATARLIDSQKQELVRRFRQGESTQTLADHFRCSPTTVTRMVRAEMSPEEYASLRDQRQRKAGRDRQIPLAIDSASGPAAGETDDHPTTPAIAADLSARHHGEEINPAPDAVDDGFEHPPGPGQVHREASFAGGTRQELEVSSEAGVRANAALEADPAASSNNLDSGDLNPEGLDSDDAEPLESEADGTTVLAIDDADDFADEDSEDDLLTTDEDAEVDEDEDDAVDSQHFQPVAVLPIAVDDQREIRPAPWSPEVLPSCAYLLVDKTVELQARPLGDIPELGRLPSEEQERQALVLFTNPRQAKRHCGRTQRVIKLPDPALLGRTAPYLRAQGISRVVIEGALYALPDGQ